MTEKSMYDTQIKPVHPTDSHEGYVIVEFTLGRRRKITLAYSTYKQTSDKQKVVIGNVEA
jgi:hypothetical protein